MKERVVDMLSVITAAALLLTVAFGFTVRHTAGPTMHTFRIVIDAGHGGEDGGAEGADGTLEKHINLSIAQPIGDLLTVLGYTVTYTRTADTMVDATGNTLRERKVSDMHNRLALMEQADLAISIHQNKFPQTKYSGAQVFYGNGNAESRVWAEAIRSSVLTLLQPHNKRELKKGDNSVFLLSRATVPLVLVECGFLSNETEREQLKNREYQRQMAFAIVGGILQV